MGLVKILGLELNSNIGYFQFEKESGQKFILDVIMDCDNELSMDSDNLEETVDYGAVAEFIAEQLDKATFNLIEHATHYIASKILLEFHICRSVEITMRKPEAPVNLKFEAMAVTEKLGWNSFALSLGSNLGNMHNNLMNAVSTILDMDNVKNVMVSSEYKTEPYGKTDQPQFINICVTGETFMSPNELLSLCGRLEKDANRVREEHWGPRTLDVDILLYEDLVVSSDTLTIPHYDMCYRDFVLKPLNEIAPHMVHPLRGMRVWELYKEFKEKHPEMEDADGN